LNYEKRRIVMIKYSVEIHLNKKKKEKANYPIFPIFSELSQIYLIFE